MICKFCIIEMKDGFVIDPGYNIKWFDNGYRFVDKDSLEVLDCWKCPDCGHSEFKDSPEYKIKMVDGELKYFIKKE